MRQCMVLSNLAAKRGAEHPDEKLGGAVRELPNWYEGGRAASAKIEVQGMSPHEVADSRGGETRSASPRPPFDARISALER
jgi:hypothetical protein